MENVISPEGVKKFKNGKIVFREGDTNKDLYIIVSGQVEVVKKILDDEVVLAKLGMGDFFGEMAIFGDETRSATIRVIDHLEAIVISEDYFRKEFNKLPEWFGNMFEELVNRIRKMDERIIAQFKSGVEFSTLHIIQLLADQYGTHSGKQLSVNKDFILDKIHYILGISKGEINKHLDKFISANIINIEDETEKILIEDKKKMEHFIDFFQCMVHAQNLDDVKKLLPHLDDEVIDTYFSMYKSIKSSHSNKFSILKT